MPDRDFYESGADKVEFFKFMVFYQRLLVNGTPGSM